MGECGKEDSFAVLDAFFDLGGNFIDTANAYQCEESEEWIGEWMEKKGNRDQMVIATKYTTGYRGHARDAEPLQSNFVGNSFKSMHISVNRSLKKMRTDYIDLLYVHWWDFTTSVEEVMHGLNALITAGKVLYLGVSDTPAWVVVKANEYARSHGLRPFSVYQGKWNASYRDMEREIIPMVSPSASSFAHTQLDTNKSHSVKIKAWHSHPGVLWARANSRQRKPAAKTTKVLLAPQSPASTKTPSQTPSRRSLKSTTLLFMASLSPTSCTRPPTYSPLLANARSNISKPM